MYDRAVTAQPVDGLERTARRRSSRCIPSGRLHSVRVISAGHAFVQNRRPSPHSHSPSERGIRRAECACLPSMQQSGLPHPPNAEGLSKKEVIRYMKRYIAREVYHPEQPLTIYRTITAHAFCSAGGMVGNVQHRGSWGRPTVLLG
jgi:hypothetical protein